MTDEELQAFRRLASTEAQTMVAEIDRLREENRRLVEAIQDALDHIHSCRPPVYVYVAVDMLRAAIEGSK